MGALCALVFVQGDHVHRVAGQPAEAGLAGVDAGLVGSLPAEDGHELARRPSVPAVRAKYAHRQWFCGANF